jgi:hypothetical protein
MHLFARDGFILIVVVSALAGCGGEAPSEPASHPLGTVVREIVAHAQPRLGRLDFAPGTSAPGLEPQSIDSLPIVADGVAGSGPPSTVELVTTSLSDTLEGGTCAGAAPGLGAFCASVTLGQFYPRTLSNTFVQVTSISDANHQPLGGHEAIGGDASQLGLDASLGLWEYTAAGAPAPGVLGMAPQNSGAREWTFLNPDDAEDYISLRVVASLTFASYTRAPASLAFVDACASGTSYGQSLTQQVSLPFPFTLYDTTAQTITLSRRGVIVLGATDLIAPKQSAALPSSGSVPDCDFILQCAVPRPAIFPFWDELFYSVNGQVCTQTSGTAPARTFAVTWDHMTRNSPTDIGSDYSFTAVLHEGTDVVDLIYGQMLGPEPNASGGGATVGVQNAEGTVATSETDSSDYGTGQAYTLSPVP